MVPGFSQKINFTVFPQMSIVLVNDCVGLRRSHMSLFPFITIHGIGYLHVFHRPVDLSGYDYFYEDLSWFGFPANVVEFFFRSAALLHVAVALRRTWSISINFTVASGS